MSKPTVATAAAVVRPHPAEQHAAGRRAALTGPASRAKRSYRSSVCGLSALTVAMLTACATREPASQAAAAPAAAASAPAFGERVGDAATTPLSDLNLVRAKIPEVLLEAQKGAYAMPADASCAALAADVKKLDAALGPDLDVPPSPNNPSLVERGSGAAGDAAIGALRGAAENVVPFRGWVRKLTGAERYSREVAAAIAAGTVRRAFLKGLGQAAACAAPAAPQQRQAQAS